MCGNTVTRQACGKQKWSVPARSLNFLLIVQRERERERERESKAGYCILCPCKVWKVFLAIEKCSKAQQATDFFC